MEEKYNSIRIMRFPLDCKHILSVCSLNLVLVYDENDWGQRQLANIIIKVCLFFFSTESRAIENNEIRLRRLFIFIFHYQLRMKKIFEEKIPIFYVLSCL
jgi:hypothetical protein